MSLSDLLGSSLVAFAIITGGIIGFAAYMTGQALAATWRPYWQLVAYCVLLAGAARFLVYALADGALLSPGGYVLGLMLIIGIASFAFRLTRARRMVAQYPWLYDRQGLFGWRRRGPA
jgi:branched-chain amino acid transport system ATP-binding protein